VLVDSHCHLDRLSDDETLDVKLQAAKARGVETMLCVCISEENRDQVIEIADTYANVYASVGVHPSDVDHKVVDAETLIGWAKKSERVVALGESGLDYYRTTEFAASQKQSFIAHLEAGRELKLPVIVHTRSAQDDTLEILEAHSCREAAGVLHCFTESWEMAKAALDLNYYVSISGIVTFKNAADLKDVAKKIPLDRLLVETDSPYLAPVPHRGKPNEPKYVREVAEYIAELRGMSFEALAERTTANFYALFNKAS
jgi:TatD DNase family protein